MKKIVIIMWTVLIAISIAACGKGPTATPSPSPSAGTNTSPTTPATTVPSGGGIVKILTIDFWGNEASQDSWYMKKLQEQSNIKVEIEITRWPDNDQRMMQALMVDDQPEILWCVQLAWQYFSSGKILDFTDDIPTKIPSLKKLMEEYPNFARDIKNNDGRVYILPNLITNSVSGSMPLFNKKFMDDNNLEKPMNFEELYILLKKVQTMGIEHPVWEYAWMDMFEYNYNAYHTKSINQNDGWYLDPASNNGQGKMVYAPVDDVDKLKAMFTWTARAWKEGLCSPENPGERCSSSGLESYLTNGKVFYFNSWWNGNDLWSTGGTLGTAYDYLGLINGPYGPPRLFDMNYIETYGAMGAKCKNKDEAFRLLDFLYSEEGSILHSWGVENETYSIDANGNRRYIDAIRYPDGENSSEGARHRDWGMAIFQWPAWRQSEDFALYHEQSQKFYQDKINAENRMPAVPRIDYLNTAQENRYHDIQRTFRDEIVSIQFPSFINGEKAFDRYAADVIAEMEKEDRLKDYRAIVDENYEKWSKR